MDLYILKLKQVLNILYTNISLCTDVECVPTVHILLVSKTTGAHHPHPTQHHPSLANPPHHAVQSHHNDRVELPPALSVHSLTGSQSHLAPLSPRKPQQPPEAKAKGMCILEQLYDTDSSYSINYISSSCSMHIE